MNQRKRPQGIEEGRGGDHQQQCQHRGRDAHGDGQGALRPRGEEHGQGGEQDEREGDGIVLGDVQQRHPRHLDEQDYEEQRPEQDGDVPQQGHRDDENDGARPTSPGGRRCRTGRSWHTCRSHHARTPCSTSLLPKYSGARPGTRHDSSDGIGNGTRRGYLSLITFLKKLCREGRSGLTQTDDRGFIGNGLLSSET